MRLPHHNSPSARDRADALLRRLTRSAVLVATGCHGGHRRGGGPGAPGGEFGIWHLNAAVPTTTSTPSTSRVDIRYRHPGAMPPRRRRQPPTPARRTTSRPVVTSGVRRIELAMTTTLMPPATRQFPGHWDYGHGRGPRPAIWPTERRRSSAPRSRPSIWPAAGSAPTPNWRISTVTPVGRWSSHRSSSRRSTWPWRWPSEPMAPSTRRSAMPLPGSGTTATSIRSVRSGIECRCHQPTSARSLASGTFTATGGPAPSGSPEACSWTSGRRPRPSWSTGPPPASPTNSTPASW